MAATHEDIHGWLLRGKQQGATHVIVACDTFDWEDYPVYVQSGEEIQEQVAKYHGRNMQKVMEVYNLAMDIDAQLREGRAWHIAVEPLEKREEREMSTEFIAQVAVLSRGTKYVAAGGGSLFDPGEHAPHILPNLKGGPLFAYLFRRFGYPSFGWDDDKQLVTYIITTPEKEVFPQVTPYMGSGGSSLMFGYCVEKAIQEEYYTLMRQDKDWETSPRYLACVRAFHASMHDLLRPVYVHDVPINCYGYVSNETYEKLPAEVEPYHAAGYPIPMAFFKDTKRYEAFTDALITLGYGSMDKGIDNVIKTAATVELYKGERQEPQ